MRFVYTTGLGSPLPAFVRSSSSVFKVYISYLWCQTYGRLSMDLIWLRPILCHIPRDLRPHHGAMHLILEQ